MRFFGESLASCTKQGGATPVAGLQFFTGRVDNTSVIHGKPVKTEKCRLAMHLTYHMNLIVNAVWRYKVDCIYIHVTWTSDMETRLAEQEPQNNEECQAC
jgi:hypothetical protein